jgi:hypothetical protein
MTINIYITIFKNKTNKKDKIIDTCKFSQSLDCFLSNMPHKKFQPQIPKRH